MGKLLNIATRTRKRSPMDTHSTISISFEKGVGADSRGMIKGNRQVTVLSIESWKEALATIDSDADWTTRRANLLIEGIDLEHSDNKILTIGNVQLEIKGILDPCGRMDEQVSGLTDALKPRWRGGVKCKILNEGDINCGDIVKIS